MKNSHLLFGKSGEDFTISYLLKKGYLIRTRNFRTRAGEIDIVAEKKGTLIFIEVKTRSSNRRGEPYESVTPAKLYRLQKAVYYYLVTHKLKNKKMQVDVISIIFNPDKSINKFNHFENLQLQWKI